MCPVIVKDELPRLIAYPVGERVLRQELGDVLPDDELGVFLLYMSGVQLNAYDPVISKETVYPVLALDRRVPQLSNDALNRLREQREKAREIVDERLVGVARADAQLRGEAGPEEEQQGEDDLLPPVQLSISIFPVKSRLRRMVEDAILERGIRAMRSWLNAGPETWHQQRPLVLVYDEERSVVSAKFAGPWGRGAQRIYR